MIFFLPFLEFYNFASVITSHQSWLYLSFLVIFRCEQTKRVDVRCHYGRKVYVSESCQLMLKESMKIRTRWGGLFKWRFFNCTGGRDVDSQWRWPASTAFGNHANASRLWDHGHSTFSWCRECPMSYSLFDFGFLGLCIDFIVVVLAFSKLQIGYVPSIQSETSFRAMCFWISSRNLYIRHYGRLFDLL